jgi:hypothetical protein
MLKFNIRRSPLSDHSYFAEKTFEASLFVGHMKEDSPRWLELRFAAGTDERTSIFEGAIGARDFSSVATMMMEADPEAAIRAFGKAMEFARVQRRDEIASDEAA